MSSMIRTASRRCCVAATQAQPRMALSPMRTLHGSRAQQLAYKNTQDRESLDPRRAENTQTSRDDDVAGDAGGTAFDPNTTRPETTYNKAQEGTAHSSGKPDDASNPLNASGANQELSKPMGDEKSSKGNGPGKEVSKGGASRRQSAPKKGDAAKLGGS